MSENKVLPAYSSPETDRFLWPDECPPPRGQKLLIYTSGGVSIVSDWSDDSNHVAWRPLPRKPARQCPSCGGFCGPRGCERENVKPAPIVMSGWKLVPVEPTEQMLDAMQESALVSFDAAIEAELSDGPAVESLHRVVYRAMLAAAPEAPDHREAMRMALEYVSWHANGECRVGTGPIPAPNDVVAALRAALGERE